MNDENMNDWAKQSIKFAEYLKSEKDKLTKQAAANQNDFNENYAVALNIDRKETKKPGVFTAGKSLDE